MTTQYNPELQSLRLEPGMVFELMIAPVRMAVLQAAVQMEMADVLADNGEPEAIARVLEVQGGEDNLVYFLDAMASMGFVEKRRGRYTNTAFAESYLRKGSPAYLGGLVETLSDMQHRNLARIPELVRSGPPVVDKGKLLHEEEHWKQSVRHLACYQKAGMAQRVSDLVASLPEYPAMRRMLDLGCGPGIMCMAMVERHPEMQGVLCDLPTVMEVAREEIEAAGLAQRVSTIAGDYNQVDFGTGYDLVWASHTLYYAKDIDRLFSRVHEALNPGGVFICLHEGLSRERTRPAGIVLSRLSLALEGQDVSFEQGEISSRLPAAGFASLETRELMLPMGEVELVIARKRG